MSQHEDQLRLGHMLDHASEAVAMCRNKSRDDLNTDRMLVLALTRLVEIVGEAANRVSKDGQKQRPEIPWPLAIGMRNRLVHGYEDVDHDILWDTIQIDFPPLIEMLKKTLGRT